ncbi:MAG: ABC transporter ATP-binding protein [Spirochaetes bacterium]|nr:ABC transporter ATP-binding protein [Spirochaetota bacterium]
MKPFVTIDNLTAGYDGDFTVSLNTALPGESIIGIIGPNGSGKTTLLRAISRVLPARTGFIAIGGKQLARMDAKTLARTVSVVSQDVAAEMITVRDFVLLGRMPHFAPMQFFESPRDYEIASRYMKLTGVDVHADKLLSAMSGGERQLAYIARALAQETPLLLLDEPTSHLDITHQVRLLDLIRRLKRELKLTIVMTIHDLNLASEYCDMLVLMKHGRVHAEGTPEEVLTYQTVEAVYDTVVIVKENPLSKKPYVFAVSGDSIQDTEISKHASVSVRRRGHVTAPSDHSKKYHRRKK